MKIKEADNAITNIIQNSDSIDYNARKSIKHMQHIKSKGKDASGIFYWKNLEKFIGIWAERTGGMHQPEIKEKIYYQISVIDSAIKLKIDYFDCVISSSINMKLSTKISGRL